MFDTIFIGTSGLLTHAKGLRVVGNNLANVNTPGFKSSQLQFADLVDQGGGSHGDSTGTGGGLASLGSQVSFQAGLDQTTGDPLNLDINGNGFFTVKRDDQILYTRAGDFSFNSKGILVNTSGDHVQALDGGGRLVDVTIDNLARSLPKATSTVQFAGNLTSTVASPPVNATVSAISVLDTGGTDHPINLSFKDNGGGDYTVTVTDAAGATVTTGDLKFSGGFPVVGSSIISFAYAPAGLTSFTVQLDFSQNVTQLTGNSTLGVSSQNGFVAGVKTDQTIDTQGNVILHYSNGQTAKGPRLAMANFKSDADLEQAAGSTFMKAAIGQVQYGYAQDDSFGTLVAGHLEGSNVDLANEFGNLILMQRGYQASSHVISTANDMIQELFDMKGNR